MSLRKVSLIFPCSSSCPGSCFVKMVLPVHGMSDHVLTLFPFVHSSSRTSSVVVIVLRPGCRSWRSGSGSAPGWNRTRRGVTWCRIQWDGVSSQKSSELCSSWSWLFAFDHEASVATPILRFSGLIGIILMPLEGCFRASWVMSDGVCLDDVLDTWSWEHLLE